MEAPLGRVIAYRNGVAYFERRATVTQAVSDQDDDAPQRGFEANTAVVPLPKVRQC